MKKFITKATALLSVLAVIACSEDSFVENMPINDGDVKEICITGKDFELDGATRSSVTISEKGASFTWDEDDVIGIFPNTGDQVSFAMDHGAGTQTATFSGGGWALKSSATYAAYYPHVYENRDLTNIPVSYLGQTQNDNNNTDHIGAYDFMAASVATPSNGTVAFDMQHLGCLVQLKITVPEPSTLSKVVLTSSTEFTETGIIDLTAETPSIVAKTQSNTLEITLNNVSTTTANENVTVYFMTSPVDLTDSRLAATIHFADKTTREVELTGKNMQAGKAYQISAEIKANFYLDGIAYMSNAGVLSEIISAEDLNTISSLQIVGKINGTDILTIRSMGALKTLDLSNANIVSGGKAYYSYEDDDDCTVNVYTQNNKITQRLFYGSKLEEITLPTNITVIGEYAFAYSKNLTSIIIPDSVTSIGTASFYNCTELKNITLSQSLETIGGRCFEGCAKLEAIDIPYGVTSIPSYAFRNCSSLLTINLPRTITVIGGSSFEGCSALKSIDLPNGVTTIYSEAFLDCSKLESIVIPPVSRIYEGTFNGCTSLTTVEIPNTVTRIDEDAFWRCTSLSQVTIPNSVTYLSGFSASGLTEIVIPASVTTIGPHAFDGCKNISSITIPEGVVTIGYDAFCRCTSLNGSLVIPNTVTQIGDQAFSGCSGLTTISLSTNLTNIGFNAFRDCSGVTTLTLPSKLQTIGNSAFAGIRLTSMTALMQSPPQSDPFWDGDSSYKIPILYVPSGCKDNYLSNVNWKASFNSIVELNN